MTASYSATGELTYYKVVVVGAPQVGKTSLVRTWAREPLPHQSTPTTGVWFDSVRMGLEAVLTIFDVGGTVPPTQMEEILFEADAVVMVYDYSRLDETLGVLDKDWIPAVNVLAKAKALFLLVACNVPINPVTNRMLPSPKKVEDWWEKVIRAGFKAMMSFPSVFHMRDHSEVSRRQLYDLIRESLGELHSSS